MFDPDCPDLLKKESRNVPLTVTIGLVAAAIICIIDYIFYGVLAKDLIVYPGMREMPDMTHMIIGYIIAGLLFSSIYALWWCPITFENRWKKGCYFGALLAIIIFLPRAFFNSALFEGWKLSTGLIQTAYQVVQFALVGYIIGEMYNKFGRKNTPSTPK